ncbi:MAG: type II toxin-antitoxin system VapC family toxin [Acidobacteria bacterium]|nr:type II toxin-antitoxin system VapC family toxin [Acidobacteriota bacterium]
MNPQEDILIFDTNIWVFGLRKHLQKTDCIELLNHLDLLLVIVPGQIVKELHRNLNDAEARAFFQLTRLLLGVEIQYTEAQPELVARYQTAGCKKGDAIIAAQVEANGVKYFVSENRHFLSEVPGLPFMVITPAEVLAEVKAKLAHE